MKRVYLTALGLYHVFFTEYGNTEFVARSNIRPLSANATTKKRPMEIKPQQQPLKKKKKQTYEEHLAKKDQEHREKQSAWLNFNTKAAKKQSLVGPKKVVPAINKKSIFATQDNPFSRVGVTGSGKPMTQYHQRGKHTYQAKNDQE